MTEVTVQEIDEWWIDYLEDEVELGLRQELEILLASSPEDQQLLSTYQLVRDWVKASDWPELATQITDNRLDWLQEKIMTQIRQTSKPPKGPTKVTQESSAESTSWHSS